MEFEWDPLKALTNLRKHRISFMGAVEAFDDPFALRVDDAAHSSAAEKRLRQIGAGSHCVIVVVFTVRGNGPQKRIRIISARIADRRERLLYEFNKRIPVS